jgi:hypothetical protein
MLSAYQQVRPNGLVAETPLKIARWLCQDASVQVKQCESTP